MDNINISCVTCNFCSIGGTGIYSSEDTCTRTGNSCKEERREAGVIFGRNRCGPSGRYYKLSEQIVAENNIEERRKHIERIGMENFLKNINARVVDVNGDYILYSFEDKESPDRFVYVIKMICPSTGRIYFGFVPPYVRTAKQARAWRFYSTEEDFSLVEET